MKKTLVIILRWIAVLPAAIIASCIAYLFVNYSQLFFVDEASKYAIYVVPVSSSFASGIALIHGGAWVAPSFKKQTALVLLIICCLVMVVGIYTTLRESRYLDFAKDIASIIGAFFGFTTSKEENLFSSLK
jgi:hypothetical protein